MIRGLIPFVLHAYMIHESILSYTQHLSLEPGPDLFGETRARARPDQTDEQAIVLPYQKNEIQFTFPLRCMKEHFLYRASVRFLWSRV